MEDNGGLHMGDFPLPCCRGFSMLATFSGSFADGHKKPDGSI